MADDEDRGVGRTENVMGVPLEIYDDGHVEVNQELLADRIERKVDHKVESYFSNCMVQVVLGVFLILLMLGVTAYIAFVVYKSDGAVPKPVTAPTPSGPVKAAAAGEFSAGAWSGAKPLVCGGNKKLSVTGVTANLPGKSAIVAKGNCQVKVENSTVTAAVGIEASGNARVTFTGGSLTGKTAAVKASANAQVVLQNAQVSGKRSSKASASIKEKGLK